MPPSWLENAVFYEVYPQSFMDSNGDGIGDLPGITQKLDYIRDLGCNAIWINPCFVSPFTDAGYDVADYYQVAPRYGTNDDLRRLFAQAHNRGMHILLDLVVGHTSIQHPWFLESKKAEENPYTHRYIWTDKMFDDEGYFIPPKGFHCIRGISDRDGSCIINFFTDQPALNYGFYNITESWQQSMDAPAPRAMREELKNIMRFWLKLGCDGFRVDMAASLVKNDPEGLGNIALWQEVRAFLDREFPEAAMISEWGDPGKSLKAGFHMDFLLQFGPTHYMELFRGSAPYFAGVKGADISEFVKTYVDNQQKSGGQGLMCIPSGNHDAKRIGTFLQGDALKLAFTFLMSMPGAPFIYYGDEIGMPMLQGLVSKEGGYNRTGSRTPMQWDDSPNAGFSAASADKLYLPVSNDLNCPTVASQIDKEDSIYHEVKKLIRIRMDYPALQSYGSIQFLINEPNSYPFAYLRSDGDQRILVILNPGTETVTFSCPYALKKVVYTLGGKVSRDETQVKVPGCFAGFYLV